MRVFLTGATGFIGSHVARLLVREGCEVYALIREGSNLRRIQDIVPLLHPVPGDLLALDQLDEDLRGVHPDLCIHLAWYAVPGKYLTSVENLGLRSASLRLASRLAHLGCGRFIGIGTCLEYDTSLGYLSERSPTRPRNLYSSSKLATQIALEKLTVTTGMSAAWVRLFYQYGPFEDERRLVPSVICSLLRNQPAMTTGGEQIRDYLHVQDVAAAIWAVSRSTLSGPVNVGSGAPVAVRDIVTKIGAITNRPELVKLGALPYNPYDPMFICADNRLLTENTDWVPKYDLEQGLRKTVEWWHTNLQVCHLVI